MASITRRRIKQELKAYEELGREIVHPPFRDWAYQQASGDHQYGNIHFVKDGDKYRVVDLVRLVMKPLRDPDMDNGRFLAKVDILSGVVRAQIEEEINEMRVMADLRYDERRSGE